jgi:hypothetical protein
VVRSEDDEEELAGLEPVADKTIEQVAKEVGQYIEDNLVAVAIVYLDNKSNELYRNVISAKPGDEFEIKVPTAADFTGRIE